MKKKQKKIASILPDQTFHSSRASTSGDERFLRSSETPIPGFQGPKFVIYSVGFSSI